MKLSFGRLEIADFKCFVGEHAIDLSAGGPGLHFICGKNHIDKMLGSNGSGKSSIWDALCWVLFGRTPNNLRGPDVKPWYGKGQPWVALQLWVDGKEHWIARTPKIITINEVSASQAEVDALIGMTVEVFLHTVLYGQGQPLFLDLEPRKKMEVLTDVLQLERWDDWAKVASDRASGLQEVLAQIEGELTGAADTRRQLEELEERNARRLAEWETDHSTKRKQLAASLKTLEAELESAELKFGEFDLKEDGAGTEAKALRTEVEEMRAGVTDAREKLARCDADIKALKRERGQLQANFDKIGKTGKCPVCEQSLKGTKIDKHQAEMQAKLDELDELIVNGDLFQMQVGVSNANARLEASLANETAFLKKEEDAQVHVRYWERLVSDKKAAVANGKRATEDVEKETNPFRDQTNGLRTKLRELDTKIEDLEDEKVKVGRAVEEARFWVKGFKEVRLYMVEEMLVELEIVANELLADVGLQDWSIQYSCEKETKSGTIKTGLDVTVMGPDNKTGAKWESWSGGEGQRLRLTGALALSQVLLNHAGIQTDLEILDEPTQHLSVEGARDLCALLSDRAKRLGRHTFFVDHIAVDSVHFSSVTTVVKDKKGSHVVQGGLQEMQPAAPVKKERVRLAG